jgi:hypothetical protein
MKTFSFFMRINFFLVLLLLAFAAIVPVKTYGEDATCDNFKPAKYSITNNGGSPNFDLNHSIQTALTVATKDTSESMYNIDIVLIMDRSGSMGYENKLPVAKNALNAVVDLVAASSNPGVRIALVTYSTNATLDQTLTTNYNAVKVAINSMKASGNTSIGGGLIAAAGALNDPLLSGRKRFIVLASDGLQNTPPEIGDGISRIPSDVTAYTVGIGKSIDEDALKNIASGTGTGAGLFFSASIDTLVDVFKKITSVIIGSFTLKNVTLDFTRDDTSHTTLTGTTPAYDGYDSANGIISWDSIGDVQNGKEKLFTINYSARSVGSNIVLNTNTLRARYTIEGLSCTDSIPVNRILITIVDNSVPICNDTTWTPNPNTICTTQTFTQTSNCGNTREARGADVCPQCSDFIDNDGDGKIDYPFDPGCWSRSDDGEFNIGSYWEF